jgi:hypothetical protein
LALLPLSLLFERTQALFWSPAFFSDPLAPFFEIIEIDYAGLISVKQSLAFSLQVGQSSFEPLLFLLFRRPIVGFLALLVLLDRHRSKTPFARQKLLHTLLKTRFLTGMTA